MMCRPREREIAFFLFCPSVWLPASVADQHIGFRLPFTQHATQRKKNIHYIWLLRMRALPHYSTAVRHLRLLCRMPLRRRPRPTLLSPTRAVLCRCSRLSCALPNAACRRSNTFFFFFCVVAPAVPLKHTFQDSMNAFSSILRVTAAIDI